MMAHRSQRGRPKGTGIDDRLRLREIARLVAANPGLKPTTAIKSLGISDPSVIRRLRDKFTACRAELERELRSAADAIMVEPARPQLRVMATEAKQADLVVPAAARMMPDKLGALPNPTADPAATLAALQRHDSLGPMAAWFGLGVVAAASAIEQQLVISQQLVRLPAVASLIRQQIAMADLVLSMTGTKRPTSAPAPAAG
jgi:hypothetical protein